MKASGIASNQTAENQVIGLLGEIQKMLPNYNTYETDDIIMMKDGYYEANSRVVFCFSSRGLPVQFL